MRIFVKVRNNEEKRVGSRCGMFLLSEACALLSAGIITQTPLHISLPFGSKRQLLYRSISFCLCGTLYFAVLIKFVFSFKHHHICLKWGIGTL